MSATNNGAASVETLVEVFRCYICLEKLRDAHLCPHCSKLCCYPCIRRWLTDQHQCPYCRALLHLHDLVNCRWAEDVTTQLDTLKINEVSKQKVQEKDKCELHQEKLTVYCSTCSKCICHQCALFNDSHAGHSFLPLDDIYKTNISVVNEHLTKLKRRHVDLICLAQDVERNVENVKLAKEERGRDIRNVTQAMQAKLEEQFKIKLDALDVQRAQLSDETELIEHTLHNIEHRLTTNGKAEVIDKQKDLLDSIQMVCQKPTINYVATPISCDFPSEIVPSYSSNTFIIANFSLRRQNVDPIYSQPLHTNGLTWRLKVYPDGNGSVRGTYLSVFLELTTGLSESSKYEYRIEMIHQLSKDPTKNIVREFASDFEVGECWGYNKFFSLEALTSEGFLDTANDTLVIRFQVRPPTYQQECRDQQWYIKQLETDNQQLNSEIKSLHEKIFLLLGRNGGDAEAAAAAGSPDGHDDDESLSETAVDVSDPNEDDDEYMFLKSNQTASDDEESAAAENDIEEASPSSPTASSIPVEPHPPRRPPIAGAGAASSLIQDENDEEVQNAFNSSKYQPTIFNDALPFIIDENGLAHSSGEPPSNAVHFRPIPQHTAGESSELSRYQPLPTNAPLNNLVVLNSAAYPVAPLSHRGARPRSHHRRPLPPLTDVVAPTEQKLVSKK